MTESHSALPGLHRNPGDAWVEGPDGTRMWGRFGSAGLLIHDPGRGILMQHRAGWSHFGGTWGIPGGARHEGEPAIAAAIREAEEEAAVPHELVELCFTSVLDLGYWTYTTVGAVARSSFEAHIHDAESAELSWVPLDEVQRLPLHPGFAASWPKLHTLLEVRPVLVVDAANVVGARPDGWWRDRAAAAERLMVSVGALREAGVPGALLGQDEVERVWPDVVVVLEGQARAALAGAAQSVVVGERPAPSRVTFVAAEGSGDDEIVARLRLAQETESDATVTVVTSDRGLRSRAEAEGARVVGATALRELLDTLS